MKFIITMTVFAMFCTAGVALVDRAMSGESVGYKLRNFHHWTVMRHWTNPKEKRVTVLLDEGVDITDASCASVLHMLDKLSKIVPNWEIFLIASSQDGFVPLRENPIDRAGIEEMLKDERDYARNAFEHIRKLENEDPDGRFIDYQRMWEKRYSAQVATGD